MSNLSLTSGISKCHGTKKKKKVSLKSPVIVTALIYEVDKKEGLRQKRRKDEQTIASRIM